MLFCFLTFKLRVLLIFLYGNFWWKDLWNVTVMKLWNVSNKPGYFSKRTCCWLLIILFILIDYGFITWYKMVTNTLYWIPDVILLFNIQISCCIGCLYPDLLERSWNNSLICDTSDTSVSFIYLLIIILCFYFNFTLFPYPPCCSKKLNRYSPRSPAIECGESGGT